MKRQLTIESAKNLLHEHMNNQNLRRHCYAVGKAMAAYFDYYQTHGEGTGRLTREQWEITGILHDADWEETAVTPELHTLKLIEWLKEYELGEDMSNVFLSHNNKLTKLRHPDTVIEWTLECCDELTGFIVAVALVMPEKKLANVTVERVLAKFKQKEFAKAVDRTQITQCEQCVGIGVEEFVGITLKAMQDDHEELGL